MTNEPDMTPVLGESKYVAVTGWRRYFTRSYWQCQWVFLRMGRPGVEIVSVGTLHIDDPDGLLADLQPAGWLEEERAKLKP